MFWVLLAAAALAGFISSGGPQSYVARRREHSRLEKQVREARSRMERKRHLLARAGKDDAFLEAEARRRLGLIHPDEIEFRFVPEAEGGERMEAIRAGSGR
jgi:cell division protein FtsB